MRGTHLGRIYMDNLGLMTDLHPLTKANAHWRSGLSRQRAVSHLFFRKIPFGGAFALSSGLELAVDFLRHFRYSVDGIQYLGAVRGADGRPCFEESFLNYLQRMSLSCDIYAIPEGTVVFPQQPLLRLEGPLIQVQLLETALLSLISWSTHFSTRAAYLVHRSKTGEVIENGWRLAPGIDGGLMASRAAFIGGCSGTSNVMAGHIYGIPLRDLPTPEYRMPFGEDAQVDPGGSDEPGLWNYRTEAAAPVGQTALPDICQVRRYYSAEGFPIGDQIFNQTEGASGPVGWNSLSKEVASLEETRSEDLLVPVFHNGELIYALPSLKKIQENGRRQQALFAGIPRGAYLQGMSLSLRQLRQEGQ